MEVLDQHQVTDDQTKSTDWTSIGARILEAATIASAIHLEELTLRSERAPSTGPRPFDAIARNLTGTGELGQAGQRVGG